MENKIRLIIDPDWDELCQCLVEIENAKGESINIGTRKIEEGLLIIEITSEDIYDANK